MKHLAALVIAGPVALEIMPIALFQGFSGWLVWYAATIALIAIGGRK